MSILCWSVFYSLIILETDSYNVPTNCNRLQKLRERNCSSEGFTKGCYVIVIKYFHIKRRHRQLILLPSCGRNYQFHGSLKMAAQNETFRSAGSLLLTFLFLA